MVFERICLHFRLSCFISFFFFVMLAYVLFQKVNSGNNMISQTYQKSRERGAADQAG